MTPDPTTFDKAAIKQFRIDARQEGKSAASALRMLMLKASALTLATAMRVPGKVRDAAKGWRWVRSSGSLKHPDDLKVKRAVRGEIKARRAANVGRPQHAKYYTKHKPLRRRVRQELMSQQQVG